MNRRAPALERRRIGLVVGDPEGVIVGSFRTGHLQEIFGVGRRHIGVDVHLVGEEDVGAGKGCAVVPDNPFAQVEGDAQVVFRDLPGFGQLAFEHKVLVIAHQACVDEAVDVIGLSILSGAHNAIFPRVMELLREEGADDILVVAGGIIPQDDIPHLKEVGISEIFGPGTQLQEIVDYIAANAKK